MGNGEETKRLPGMLNDDNHRTRTLWFYWPLCSLLLCSGSLLGNICSPGIPRNGRSLNCFRVLSLSMNVLSCQYKKLTTRLWSEIPFRNAATVWRFGDTTGRVLGWVIWFISGWLGSSEIYFYNFQCYIKSFPRAQSKPL